MKCEQAGELIIDSLQGRLGPKATAELELHLAECPACAQESQGLQAVWDKLGSFQQIEPNPALDARFYGMLGAYAQGLEEGQRPAPRRSALLDWSAALWPRRPDWQLALALALFGLGLFLGPVLNGPMGRGGHSAETDGPALTQLRREVSGLKELVALSLLQQASATERLRGVEWTYRLNRPDQTVLAALLRALDSDPNVNVRLAAVDALQSCLQQDGVRKGLLETLPRQDSPLVQVELIDLMVEAKEAAVVPVLKTLLRKADLDETVRQRAEWGLEQFT